MSTAPSARRAGLPVDVSQRSFGELLGEVTNDLSTLLRQEIELAKAEARQEAAKAGQAGGMLAGTGVAAHMTLLFVSIAVWWGLANFINGGWAALIVAVVWAVIAVALTAAARAKLRELRGLPRTIDSVKEIPAAIRPEGGPNHEH